MTVEEIREELFRLQDTGYRDMQCRIIPNIPQEKIIGVRTPELRSLAKRLMGDEQTDAFLSDLPHKYFEEDQLHAFIISLIRDAGVCMDRLNAFLPYVDNWATCDQMSPKVFGKHKDMLLQQIRIWIASDRTYEVRFAAGMLMEHFLDDAFDISYPGMVADISSEEYYVNMMRAWYFATALAKQYDAVIPFIENRVLDRWTHNKAVQKAVESRRITAEQKTYLRSLKIR